MYIIQRERSPCGSGTLSLDKVLVKYFKSLIYIYIYIYMYIHIYNVYYNIIYTCVCIYIYKITYFNIKATCSNDPFINDNMNFLDYFVIIIMSFFSKIYDAYGGKSKDIDVSIK